MRNHLIRPQFHILLTILAMALIFIQSALPENLSAEFSNGSVQPIVQLTDGDLFTIDRVVRKLAHDQLRLFQKAFLLFLLHRLCRSAIIKPQVNHGMDGIGQVVACVFSWLLVWFPVGTGPAGRGAASDRM